MKTQNGDVKTRDLGGWNRGMQRGWLVKPIDQQCSLLLFAFCKQIG